MQANLSPFNIDLLLLNDQEIQTLLPVTSLDSLDGASKNFHPNGLFSPEIFGKVGTEHRNRRFSYVNLKVDLIHPTIFYAVVKLKRLYGEIMSGSSYAIWDESINDFVKTNFMEGSTGYHYFLEHLPKIVFTKNDSTSRTFNIELVDKYVNDCLLKRFIVIPAGVRDFEFDDTGKPSEDEINLLYRKILALSNMIPTSIPVEHIDTLDATRYNLQLAINAVYDYLKNLIEGKRKLALGKWASRNVYNGTRNVITGLAPDTDSLDDVRTVKHNETIVGLYQFMKATLPVSIFKIRNGFLTKVFPGPQVPALLVNKKTLKPEHVRITSDLFDEWMSEEGVEKVISRYGEEGLRHLPLSYKDYYFGLIYVGPWLGKTVVKLLQDIDDVPEGVDKKLIKPLTFTELMYLSVYGFSKDIPAFITRYPITGLGSIYPSMSHLKSTTDDIIVEELDDNWNLTGKVAPHFPIRGKQFFNSISPSLAHLGRLGAD